MMLRDMMKYVSGACCAAVMVCTNGVIKAMDGNYYAKFYRDSLSAMYANYGAGKWLSDGMRFITNEFIEESTKLRSIPLVNDGKVELERWLSCTKDSAMFIVGWDVDTRLAGGGFITEMIDIFSGSGEQFKGSIEQLKLIQARLIGTLDD
jgi:hypothetical protein